MINVLRTVQTDEFQYRLIKNNQGYTNKFTPSQKEKLTAIIKNIGVELQKISL